MENRVPPHPPGQISLQWRPITGLLGLCFKIFFLRILTLGIYHFWGKTEVRRKIWSAVHLQGQPLQYTGTGKELFLGFLIVTFLIILPLYAALVSAQFYFGPNDPKTAIATLIFFVIIMYLIGVAQYRARRYRLSRTNWRGIRGTMAGSPWRYGWTYLWTSALIPLTLGWIIPWVSVKLQKFLTDDTRFGNMPMRFQGSAGPLYRPFTIFWLGMIALYAIGAYLVYLFVWKDFFVTAQQGGEPSLKALGLFYLIIFGFVIAAVIIGAWYNSKVFNYFAASTHIDQARFRLQTTPGSLIGLMIGNMLIALLTLGIAVPFVQMRLARYLVNRMGIDGSIDFQKIAQSQAEMDRTGEGLAEAFDIDAF